MAARGRTSEDLVIKSKCSAGVIQAAPAFFDLDKGVDLTLHWLNEAAEAGCDLVLFPESYIPGYPRGLDFDARVGSRSVKSQEMWLRYWKNSLSLDSPEFKRISEEICRLKLFVGLGITERDETGGSLYCTLLYFNDNGQLIGRHRKLKPTGLERYIWGEGTAEDLITVSTPAGRVGGLICWENYMPLARMAMYEQGVEIYMAPTADMRDSWQDSMRHIAREGRCFILSANQFVRKNDIPDDLMGLIPEEPGVICRGGSAIYDPFGNVLAGPLWDQEGLLIAALDHDVLVRSKLEFDAVGHYSRKDIFSFNVKREDDDQHQGKNIQRQMRES